MYSEKTVEIFGFKLGSGLQIKEPCLSISFSLPPDARVQGPLLHYITHLYLRLSSLNTTVKTSCFTFQRKETNLPGPSSRPLACRTALCRNQGLSVRHGGQTDVYSPKHTSRTDLPVVPSLPPVKFGIFDIVSCVFCFNRLAHTTLNNSYKSSSRSLMKFGSQSLGKTSSLISCEKQTLA